MILSAQQSEFIHNNCEVSDQYNYDVKAQKTLVSEEEVGLLVVGKYRDKIGQLGKELKKLDSNNPALAKARTWWKTDDTYSNQSFDIKMLLIHTIKSVKLAKKLAKTSMKLAGK